MTSRLEQCNVLYVARHLTLIFSLNIDNLHLRASFFAEAGAGSPELDFNLSEREYAIGINLAIIDREAYRVIGNLRFTNF